MGSTLDEMRLYVAYLAQEGVPLTREAYAPLLEQLFGSTPAERARRVPARVAAAYPIGEGQRVPDLLGTAWSDYNALTGIGNCNVLHTSSLLRSLGPVYQWQFADRQAPVIGVAIPAEPPIDFEMGAVHSSELNYLFPGFDNRSTMAAAPLAPASQALADRLLQYVTSFVRDGVPTAAGGPTWPTYDDSATVLRMTPETDSLIDAAAHHRCDLWATLYPEQFRRK
jgi:para-nitrobenzyl esterase